jgi:hypothetical protein
MSTGERCADSEYASEYGVRRGPRFAFFYASEWNEGAIEVADEEQPMDETEPGRERSRSPEYDVTNSTVKQIEPDHHWWFGDSNNLAIWVNHAIFWQYSGNIVLRNILAIFSQYFSQYSGNSLAVFLAILSCTILWQYSGNSVL